MSTSATEPITDAPTFIQELTAVINRHCMERGSDTPDFILAEYLLGCLDAWATGIAAREKWYGRPQAYHPRPPLGTRRALDPEAEDDDEPREPDCPDEPEPEEPPFYYDGTGWPERRKPI